MAAVNILDTSVRPPNSILNLDKSIEPWHAQVTKAASILDLDLDSIWICIIENCETLSQRDTAVEPRVEWTLKWLLKKFQPQEGQPSEECKSLQAWILLKEVVARCPTVNVARFLRAHQFVSIVETLFLYIRDDTVSRLEGSDKEVESSVEPVAENQVSKKRKRDCSESAPKPKKAQLTDANALFIVACSVMGHVIALTKLLSVGSRDYAAEHLKHALKCPSQSAADILGCAFYITNDLLQNLKITSNPQRARSSKTNEDTAYVYCLAPLVEFWDLHLARTHKGSADTARRSFMSSCAIPSLQVLQTCQEWANPGDDAGHVSSMLTRLLTDYVILPFRSRNLSDNRQSAQAEAQNTRTFSDELSSALDKRPLAPRNADIRADENTKNHLKGSLLSLLFRQSIKSRPQGIQRLRQSEDLWLEKLYLQLDIVANPIHDPETSSIAHKGYRRLLRQLLEIAVEAKLYLSVSTLQQTLQNASGLFENHDDQHVDWGIVSLCLSIDADVFVIPKSRDQDESDALYRPPNEYLRHLLRALTNYQMGCIEGDHSTTSNTLILLLDGFVRARDLLGFTQHWREQLSHIMNEAENAPLHNCVWDADALQVSVSRHVETLATPQVSEIILNSSKFVTVCLQGTNDDKWSWLQELVILESLLGGIVEEHTLEKLGDEVQSIFVLLTNCLAERKIEHSRYRWRLWRIMTIISERWSTKHGYHKIKFAISTAIRHALRILKKLPIWNDESLASRLEYLEHYHAFRFIIGFTASDEVLDESSFLTLRRTEKAIQRITNIMEPLYRRIESDVWGTFKDDGQNFEGFRPDSCINSIGAMYLAYTSLIISSLDTIGRVDAKIQTCLIEQFYSCVLHHRRSSLQFNHNHVDLTWPWQQLLRKVALTDSSQLRNCIKSFQVKRYLQVSRFAEPEYWNIGSVNYRVGFENLITIPVEDLSRSQRSILANRLLRILTSCNMMSIANITVHLTALQKLVDKPLNSMCILNNQETSSDGEPQPKPRRDIALLQLARTIDDNFKWSVDNVECVDCFEKLSQTVLKYLISTFDRENSIKHLQLLYDQLATTPEQRYKKRPCESSFLIIAKVALTAFHDHRDKLSTVLSDFISTLQTTRQMHLENLVLGVERIIENPSVFHIVKRSEMKDRYSLGIHLNCIVAYVDLIRIHPDLADESGITRKLHAISDRLQQLSHRDSLGPDGGYDAFESIEYIAISVARLKMAISHGDDGLLPYLVDLSSVFRKDEKIEAQPDLPTLEKTRQLPIFSSVARRTTLFNIQKAISTLGPAQKAQLLSSIVSGSNGGDSLTSRLYLMRVVFLSLSNEETEEMRTALSKACTWLCHELGRDIDYHTALIAMQCLGAFLQKQTRYVNQWQTDNMLSTISIVSNRVKARRENMQSGMLFMGLGRLFTTILRLHRRRIGGRYHLVLPALQGLLGCLFIPYSRTEGDAEPQSVFAAQHAAEYSRILTMLCDPTVSAVTTSKTRSRLELNDETKKARSIAGQYLQYLIIEYCGCQLEGKILPEMRSAINVGLWAVLEVINKDVLRTMNAAMDSSRRSVFKALYDDFKKFGKWKGG